MNEEKNEQVIDMRDKELAELRARCEQLEREINGLKNGNMMLQETDVRMSMKMTGVT